MASAALLMLTKEVTAVNGLPAGAERKAACARPRRRFWDTIASIQASLGPLDDLNDSEGASVWQHDRAREAVDCCTELLEVLADLETCEKDSCVVTPGRWASTEYVALADEISLQLRRAERILGLFEEDAPAEGQPEEAESSAATRMADGIPPGCPGETCDHFEPRPRAGSSLSASEEAGPRPRIGSGGGEKGRRQRAGSGEKARRTPVRLTMDQLHDLEDDDFHRCQHAANGICEKGCTVGGCEVNVVEAW